MESAKSRFLRYVTYYTTSDEFTGTSPSTERQKDLGRALMQELEALKLEDVHMDDCGNVLATLPASEGVGRARHRAHRAHGHRSRRFGRKRQAPPRALRGRRAEAQRHCLPHRGALPRP